MSWLADLAFDWQILTTTLAVLDVVVAALTVTWILMAKKDSTSAVAWILLVIFLPLIGAGFFVLFGYQHVSRPLNRKRRHTKRFQQKHPKPPRDEGHTDTPPDEEDRPDLQALAHLAQRFGASPPSFGNRVTFYHEGNAAFAALLAEIEKAHHHVHLEYYIYQPDRAGRQVLDLLVAKAREGVEVRLMYDAIGARRFTRLPWRTFADAGGKYCEFLPINPLRRRVQINLRNHRKILVVDGQVAFTGGMNVGDEYLGRDPRFGFWRDTHLRIEGPAASDLQRVFVEDWDFAAGEDLTDTAYFPPTRRNGPVGAQVVESGPDRESKAIREVFFAAILQARDRLWIATPYYVPDAGLQDALCLAAYRGVDVRLLSVYHPDQWVPYLAGRYYWGELLRAGVKVYQYTKGMMHAKLMLVDGRWASVGTANLDNRSMHLNFEVNCLFSTPAVVAELEATFRDDLRTAVRLDRHVFGTRPFASRLLENTCRLLSPIL